MQTTKSPRSLIIPSLLILWPAVTLLIRNGPVTTIILTRVQMMRPPRNPERQTKSTTQVFFCRRWGKVSWTAVITVSSNANCQHTEPSIINPAVIKTHQRWGERKNIISPTNECHRTLQSWTQPVNGDPSTRGQGKKELLSGNNSTSTLTCLVWF